GWRAVALRQRDHGAPGALHRAGAGRRARAAGRGSADAHVAGAARRQGGRVPGRQCLPPRHPGLRPQRQHGDDAARISVFFGGMTVAPLTQVLILLLASVVVVAITRRWGLPPISGYLIVGMLLGPLAFG